MNRRAFLGLMAVSLASAACGAPPAGTSTTQKPAAPISVSPTQPVATTAPAAPVATVTPATRPVAATSDRLLLRDGTGATSRIVAIDAARGTVMYSMPPGLPLTDGSHWISLLPSGGQTAITLRKTSDGATTRSINVKGEFRDGAVSHDDRLLLLLQPPPSATSPTTSMALVDLQSGEVMEQAQLDGQYLPDTVSLDGSAIYLVELHPERKANAYQVALYDRSQHKIVGPIVDKRSAQSIMSGQKVTHAWSRSGEWLYSLYLDPGPSGDGAFVHALNVPSKFAICIDLPSHGTEEVLRHYSLVTSPGDDVLYATNPALGVINYWRVGEFDAQGLPFVIPEPTVSSVTAMPRASGGFGAGARSYNNSTISLDGSTIFVGTDRGILRTGGSAGGSQKSELWLPDRSVSSVGMSPTGKVLYALVAQPEPQIIALDTADGSQIGDLSGIVARPSGIEQVTAS